MKKYQKETIDLIVTGSNTVDVEETMENKDINVEEEVARLMEKLLSNQVFEEELAALSKDPITMLMPVGEQKRFFLFSPVLNIYRGVSAPAEVTIMEESNGKETLGIIHNVVYLIPDRYLKEVGYN